jgi:hypothetical protein
MSDDFTFSSSSSTSSSSVNSSTGRGYTSEGSDDHGRVRIPLEPNTPIDLYVENPNGDVRVELGNEVDAIINWDRSSSSDGPGPVITVGDVAVNVNATDAGANRIEVKVSYPPFWPAGDFGKSVLKFLEGGMRGANPFRGLGRVNSDFDILVVLPRAHVQKNQANVRVRTANGDVSIAEIAGSVDVAAANGDIGARHISGEVSVNAANSDVLLDHVNGQVTARNVSGDIQVLESSLSRFTVNSVSGDVTMVASLGGESSRIETVSGDIHLDLAFPSTVGGSIAMKSVSGSAKMDSNFRSVGKRTWRIGPSADSGPSISVKTVSGDLQVSGKLSDDNRPTERVTFVPPVRTENRQPTAPIVTPPPVAPPPAAPEPPTRHGGDPRLAILQMVERGEIDIDEAMKRLDALE